MCSTLIFSFFFFNDTATTEIYTLSLHDALPICSTIPCFFVYFWSANCALPLQRVALSKAPSKPENGHVAGFVWFQPQREDRKSTRLNSSHSQISYAVFCLKKKKIEYKHDDCICT